ncbi:MAG: tyrosine-type recombinase/integrase [Bacteroidota bacterium]|nr:tyrosine-type recombinase/integrase [Bacteroidota bacterium]
MKSRFELHTASYQLLLNGFDKMIRVAGYKLGKGSMYQDYVKEFLSYLENKGLLKIKALQTIDMVKYYEYLIERPNLKTGGVLASSTVSGHMFAIGLFFDYMLEENKITRSIILPKHARGNGMQRNIVSVEEIKILIDAVENKRDKAILSLAYGCGLRRTEIEQLEVSDIQLTKGFMIVRKAKNDKRREIPLSNAIIRDLKDYLVNERHSYLKENTKHKTEAFLINNKGKMMKGDHINERLKELIIKTDNLDIIKKEITLHCLRHSIATHLLDNGATIEFVKDFLGHSEIDTVHIYARRRKLKQHLIKN